MAKSPTHKLEEHQKLFVVERLAAYDSPKEVADALRAEYGVSIAPQSVEAYDPTKRAGERLAKKWCILFEKARKSFLQDVECIPEANKAVRVRRLASMARRADSAGNMVLAAQLYEQIAKEVGRVYTNHRELTGKGGGPMQFQNLTDEQLNAELAAALAGLAGGAADA